MTIGSPPINRPGRMELRAIQQGFDNTRERFRALETEFTALRDAATAAKTSQSIDALTRKLTILASQVAALSASLSGSSDDTAAPSTTTILIEGGASNDENAMQNTPFLLKPVTLGLTAANVLNPPTLTGGVGVTPAKTFILLKSLRVVNRTAGAVNVSVFLGATAGSAAGTEVGFSASVVPANSFLEVFFGGAGLRLETTDFLTALASATASLSLSAQGEIGVCA